MDSTRLLSKNNYITNGFLSKLISQIFNNQLYIFHRSLGLISYNALKPIQHLSINITIPSVSQTTNAPTSACPNSRYKNNDHYIKGPFGFIENIQYIRFQFVLFKDRRSFFCSLVKKSRSLIRKSNMLKSRNFSLQFFIFSNQYIFL